MAKLVCEQRCEIVGALPMRSGKSGRRGERRLPVVAKERVRVEDLPGKRGGRTRSHARAGRVGRDHTREREHSGAVMRGQRQLRVESGHQPVVPDDQVPAEVLAEEREPDPGQSGIWLVVRREHARECLGLEYPAVLG